ncbi:hypothetical protein CSUI_007576 [Cystoisospora suis]|uniref:Uncharacterized protein n=1 Tax=Cystoisospora suis TaxID=483139 RepID=A0A2C6KPQ8_9APIC|nr:hypothetical protein CSUI_007576 [Cystoisospora suis]
MTEGKSTRQECVILAPVTPRKPTDTCLSETLLLLSMMLRSQELSSRFLLS